MLKGINNFVNFKQTTDAVSGQKSFIFDTIKTKPQPNDTVEISTNSKENDSKWRKWGKIAAGVAAVVLATAGVIIGHKTITAKKAEKLSAEARKLEEEAREKAQKMAEEARIKAEQQAKAEAERQAKIEAERQAQIKAQKEAEAKAKAEAEEKARIEAQKAAEVKAKKERQVHNQKFISGLETSSKWDSYFSGMSRFGKDGIPLKYSRDSFLTDLKSEIDKLSPEEGQKIQQRFNLKLNETGFNSVGVEIEGIPKIPENLETEPEKKIAKIIRSFTEENETTFENPEQKQLYDAIIQTIPEFTSIIGKKQHGTHQYSVDVHTLMNLSDNLRDIRVKGLDEESQKVLKYSTILHDLGKDFIADFVPDSGHALRSAEIAKPILERLNLSEQTKERILKQIKNHHWFKDYNQGIVSPEQIVAKFETTQDYLIAEIMAKSDLKNVSNTFHHGCMGTETQAEFDSVMSEKFAPIKKIFFDKIAEAKGLKPDKHGIRPISCEEEYYDTLNRLSSLRIRSIYADGKVEKTDDVMGYLLDDWSGSVDVPAKMKGVLAYTGVSGNPNGHYAKYELYRDLNRYLQKNQDVVMPKVEDGVTLFRKESEEILENNLVNVTSEEAKDFIRCIDYSLKEVDKEFGRYEGLVYRNGRFSSDGGQYWSTSRKNDLHLFDDVQEYHVIKTNSGHKISEFEKKYHNVHPNENEILLSRGGKYKEVTGSQYEEERVKLAQDRYEYYKKLDEEFFISKGQPPKYNYSFEDILARTHVWTEG